MNSIRVLPEPQQTVYAHWRVMINGVEVLAQMIGHARGARPGYRCDLKITFDGPWYQSAVAALHNAWEF